MMNSKELVHVIDSMAKEKSIDRGMLFEALEEAIQKAARTRYGHEIEVRVDIDKRTGEIALSRCREVVDSNQDTVGDSSKITLDEALAIKKDAKVGDVLVDPLPPMDFGRVAAQTVRQVVTQRVRDIERDREFNEFVDFKHKIVTGVVKRMEFGNIILSLGEFSEGYIAKRELIQRENLKVGDRVKAYVLDVRREVSGPQILLSRSHPQFMVELFKQEVPEIADGTIEIMGAARDPGSRAKIAVRTFDPSIDPVGSCVGVRGVRVQSITDELQGEKIDIVMWDEDVEVYLKNAMVPAKIQNIIPDPRDEKKAIIVVPKDQLSLAIGRRGQNVRLASQLTGLRLDVMSEDQEKEQRAKLFEERTELFVNTLDLDKIIGQLLAIEGYVSVDDIAESTVEELMEIEGFDEDIAKELIARARDAVKSQSEERLKELVKSGKVSNDLIKFAPLNDKEKELVISGGCYSLKDLADLSGDELEEVFKGEKTLEECNSIIMQAREVVFK